ncbi:MAG: Cys-tRNA(Pro) deacylase [Marmoricola sp.]
MTAKRKQAAGTPATTALEGAGVPYTVHAYEHDPTAGSYGLEAAEALGLDPESVLKTLVATVDDALVVAVIPVARQLDLKALAAAAGGKRAAMAPPATAERSTGYVLGGISPLGQRRPLPTWVEESVRGLSVVYVSAGRRGCDLGLAPDALVALTQGRWAPLAR